MQNLTILASAIPEISMEALKFKVGHRLVIWYDQGYARYSHSSAMSPFDKVHMTSYLPIIEK